MSDDLRQEADRLAPELVRWRRELHRHPELAFEEHRTAEFVERRLRELDLDRIETAVARTGVVGVLRAREATGPAVLLRADMDALPVREVEGREYGSEVEGRMHACGHDGHTAMLLGAATLLCRRAAALRRDVVFCFQPAEESCGGAERMLEAGLLDMVETGSAYAIHLWSQWEHGTVHVRSGPTMAAQDEFTARIIGRGGHGAAPHANRDPIVAAAHAVTALQTIVSRWVDPVQPAVVTIGSFHGGSAPNITPDEVTLEGTMRCFDEDVRRLVSERVAATLRSTCDAHGCDLDLDLRSGYPAVINAERESRIVREVAGKVVGEANVYEHAPLAASEDFSYFLQRLPGAFVFLGAGNAERGIVAPHHSPQFDIEESVLPRGAELLARLALYDA